MKDIKGMLKKNKKKALAFAVMTAFSVSMASTFTACNNYDDDDDDDDQQGYSSGGGTTYWHSFNSGSSGSKSSSGSKISSGSKSSGYSGARGGFSS